MNDMVKKAVIGAFAAVGAYFASWGVDVEMWQEAITPELIVGLTTFVTVMVTAVYKKFMPASWNPMNWFWK